MAHEQQSFGRNVLSPGEKELYLEQISQVEAQRDQARRECEVALIENQVLQKALMKNGGSISSSINNEVIKKCLMDVRLQSLFSIQEKLQKTQDHLQKAYNPRIFIGLLESLINEMQCKLHPDLENTFSKVMELSLVLSQIKNHTQSGETSNILSKMRDILQLEINGLISESI